MTSATRERRISGTRLVALRAQVLHTDQPFDPSGPLCGTHARTCWASVGDRNLLVPGSLHSPPRTAHAAPKAHIHNVSYFLGSGWWILWYGVLWLALSPFAVMTAGLTRATPNDPMPLMETSFAIGSVGLFVLMIATAIAGYFWTAGGSAHGVWPYVRNIGGAILLALIVGFALIFGAAYCRHTQAADA